MGSEFAGLGGEPLGVDIELADITELTPLQRYGAEKWGQVALEANTVYELDNADTTRASNRYLNAFKNALQESAGIDDIDADMWVEAAFGADDERFGQVLGFYGEAPKKADVAQSLHYLTRLAEKGNVTALKTEVAAYVAIIRHSVGADELSPHDARLLKDFGADDRGIERLNEMVEGLEVPDLDRDTVVAHAYAANAEPQIPSTFGPGRSL